MHLCATKQENLIKGAWENYVINSTVNFPKVRGGLLDLSNFQKPVRFEWDVWSTRW